MTEPTYQSVQDVVDDVRALGPLGGSAYGQSAATAFKLAAADPAIESAAALFASLDQLVAVLLAEKPTMATIHNAQALIIEKTRRERETTLQMKKAAIIKRAELFIALSQQAVERLGQVGGNLIEDGQVVMMHSFSKSLMSIFRQAREMGKDFRVICSESRPTHESRVALKQLTGWGIPVTYVLDAAVATLLPQAHWCLVGADSLSIDGAAANKVGTYQLAVLAHQFNKPLYVATEVMKLQRKTIEGQPIQLEHRPAHEVLKQLHPGFEFPDGVTVWNQFFDLTPAALIRSLITEQGIISPGAIGAAWDKLAAAFE
ncbi:MAG: translation initiation factor eIF-2B [Anaerolineae bacterium]|nr:translation initiation factor eIF-2B [Anaerolineae bacterium]